MEPFKLLVAIVLIGIVASLGVALFHLVHDRKGETKSMVRALTVRISLSDKGLEAYEVVNKLYHRQLGSIEAVGEISGEDFRSLNKALVRLERFWSDQIRYQL